MAKATAPAGNTTPSATQFVAFRARGPFRFGLPYASKAAEQAGKAGQVYLTNVPLFIQQVLVPNQGQVELAQQPVRLPCLPIDLWPTENFSGKRLLVLLPGQALGDCVQATMALQALLDHRGVRQITVGCAGPAHDIVASNPRLTVRPLWLDHAAVKAFDHVLDLGHLPSAGDIDIWPVDFEARMLDAFGIPPSPAYPPEARALPVDRPLRIGLLPLASSPLRTLPATVVTALLEALTPFGEVTLCLNRNQGQGRLLQAALPEPPAHVQVIDAFPSVADLMAAIQSFDYAIFADSGPAHMAKLFRTPGVAVYTSAPGEVLQGRFQNLTRYSVSFSGPYCNAPCGLAKVRQSADGRIGCMGSLGVDLAGLPTVPGGSDAAVVERLTAEPVPCVAHLGSNRQELARFVASDLQQRLDGPGA